MKEQDLREKIADELYNFKSITTNVDQCVQIAKDYAEKEAIEFSQWMHENTVYSGNEKYSVLNVKEYQTLQQCYGIYLTTKTK